MKKQQGFSFKQLLLYLIILALAVGFGFWMNKTREDKTDITNNNISLQTGTYLPQTRSLQSFELTDENGKTFTNKNLQGKWTFVFFGFTNCPNICPTTLSVLKQVHETLGKNNQVANANVLFVSVDPQRDTTKRINSFVHSFSQDFHGATGSKQQLDALSRQMGIVYMKTKTKNPNAPATDYNIDHSGTIVLVNPQGQLQAFFSMPHDANELTSAYETIVAAKTT